MGNKVVQAFAKYTYDALGQRIRFKDVGYHNNQSFTFDALLLYKEGVMYHIHQENHTCTKSKLSQDFQPMEVPQDASLVGQFILGSSSGPGEGLLVNTWTGKLPEDGSYTSTFTEFGCLPVSIISTTEEYGFTLTSFFN